LITGYKLRSFSASDGRTGIESPANKPPRVRPSLEHCESSTCSIPRAISTTWVRHQQGAPLIMIHRHDPSSPSARHHRRGWSQPYPAPPDWRSVAVRARAAPANRNHASRQARGQCLGHFDRRRRLIIGVAQRADQWRQIQGPAPQPRALAHNLGRRTGFLLFRIALAGVIAPRRVSPPLRCFAGKILAIRANNGTANRLPPRVRSGAGFRRSRAGAALHFRRCQQRVLALSH